MKTLIRYIAVVALLAGLNSCLPEWYGEEPVATDGTVEVTFSVQLPEPVPVVTKGKMGEGPVGTDFKIYLCIYGPGDGAVQNWIEATRLSFTSDGTYITGGTFRAMLPLTYDRRIVHVLANPPASVIPTTTGYLDDIMEDMVTVKGSDDECSYWQEIVLENGIQGEGNPFGPTPELQAAFTNIQLVRNFAKVIVTNPDESSLLYGHFKVTRWTLINVPKRGYVAPYNPDWASDGWTTRFPEGYTSSYLNAAITAGTLGNLHSKLTTVDNYLGYMPALADGIIDESYPGNPPASGATNATYVAGGSPLYMYERPIPTTDARQTAVLVEVEFDEGYVPEDSPTPSVRKYWYKIEVLNDEQSYFPFLRDVVYRLNLQGLKNAGEATAQAAFNGAYFGNISASLETAGLNELSDGKSLVHVDVMDYTFTTGSTASHTEEVTLLKPENEWTDPATPEAALYWFIPDGTSTDPAMTTAYAASQAGICDIKVELLAVDGYEAAVTAVERLTNSGPDDYNGALKVTLAETGSAVKKSVIRVSGRIGDDVASNTHKYIYREITVNLMNKQNLAHVWKDDDEVEHNDETAITSTPQGISGTGKPVNISIFLPENLGASVFPIQLRIEAENNTLSATSPDLPVQSGPSVFTSKAGKNTFYYIYTISYSDYRKLNTETKKYDYYYEFPITLYTGKPGSNTTAIDIRDMAGLFNPTTLQL